MASSTGGNRQAGPAQYLIDGESYPRVPFGAETDDLRAGDAPCLGCGARAGELHTPGCEAEECPLCQYPVHDCDCEISPLSQG